MLDFDTWHHVWIIALSDFDVIYFRDWNNFSTSFETIENNCHNCIYFSKTAIDIADLIIRTLDDAAKADSASAMAKILQTARNIVELYAWTSPRKHDSEISSVPVLAGSNLHCLKMFCFLNIILYQSYSETCCNSV